MKTVWKFDLDTDDYNSFSMPRYSVILSVQEQFGKVKMWVLCDPNEKQYEIRKFRLAGTGHSIEENIKSFIGTFQLLSGNFVGHLFEVYE